MTEFTMITWILGPSVGGKITDEEAPVFSERI